MGDHDHRAGVPSTSVADRAIVLAIVVPINRMYVGAHLPLDLVGGAALGVTVASAVNLLIGVPVHAPAENTRAGPITDV